MRGLRLLMDMLTTEALLGSMLREQGSFPDRIAALLKG